MKPNTGQAGINISTSTQEHIKTSTLVLFDFDGTITTKDTLIEFVQFYRGRSQYFIGLFLMAPVLALFLSRLIPNWKAKQHFLTHYFKGEKIMFFNSRCMEFTRKVLPGLIRPDALKAIEAY